MYPMPRKPVGGVVGAPDERRRPVAGHEHDRRLPFRDAVDVHLERLVHGHVHRKGHRDPERLRPVARVPDRVQRPLAPRERLLLADDRVGVAGSQLGLVPGERIARGQPARDPRGEGTRIGDEVGVGLRAGDDLGRVAHGQQLVSSVVGRHRTRVRSGRHPAMGPRRCGLLLRSGHGCRCPRRRAAGGRGRRRGRRAVPVPRAGPGAEAAVRRAGRAERKSTLGDRGERAAGPAAQVTPLPDGRHAPPVARDRLPHRARLRREGPVRRRDPRERPPRPGQRGQHVRLSAVAHRPRGGQPDRVARRTPRKEPPPGSGDGSCAGE